MFYCVSLINVIHIVTDLSAAGHGVGAEVGLQRRPDGAQSDPAWRQRPEGGAAGQPEELQEEGSACGGAGGGSEGETIR